ncbi:unnamed protein product, partial [Ilex paraguariensis]
NQRQCDYDRLHPTFPPWQYAKEEFCNMAMPVVGSSYVPNAAKKEECRGESADKATESRA